MVHLEETHADQYILPLTDKAYDLIRKEKNLEFKGKKSISLDVFLENCSNTELKETLGQLADIDPYLLIESYKAHTCDNTAYLTQKLAREEGIDTGRALFMLEQSDNFDVYSDALPIRDALETLGYEIHGYCIEGIRPGKIHKFRKKKVQEKEGVKKTCAGNPPAKQSAQSKNIKLTKHERLSLIKERYRKVVLEPRQQIAQEIADDH